jgi:hypothetical protein
MVDFTLTEEQQSMREMAHDFAAHEIRPVYRGMNAPIDHAPIEMKPPTSAP